MKITMTGLMLLVLCLPTTFAQDDTQLFLPEDAVARFGKGSLLEVQYSPDGSRLAVASSIGIWLYDTTTYQEVALLAASVDWATRMVFSPDGKTLANRGHDGAVWLWECQNG